MKGNKFITLGLVAIIVVLVALIGVQSIPVGIALPSDAVKLSECVPNMGEHWGNPADLPFGPIYLVDKSAVVGIEYMMHEDELEENTLEIGSEKIGVPAVMPAMGIEYDHIELSFLPEGHEGDEEPHYDVHMYVVSAEGQQKLCQ